MNYIKTIEVRRDDYELPKLVSYFESVGYIHKTENEEHLFRLIPNRKSKGMRKISCSIFLKIENDKFIFNINPNTAGMITTGVEYFFNLEIETAVSIMLFDNALEEKWKDFKNKDRIAFLIFIGAIVIIAGFIGVILGLAIT